MANLLAGFLRGLGYELHKIHSDHVKKESIPAALPPTVNPVWPLPRNSDLSDDEIRQGFAKHSLWHYAYAFEGGLAFSARHNKPGALTDSPERPLQRFKHFMPYLVEACGGTLHGKRVLDIACNSGFWSVQCALLGAHVTGFDARVELIEQAELIKRVVGLENVDFRVLDFWAMSPETLGGTFDIVLNLGVLYHLPKPLEVLERTKAMAEQFIVLDTAVHPTENPCIHLRWEEPTDIRSAAQAGIVAVPSTKSVGYMLKHVGATDWFEIPIRSRDMPHDYLKHKRASWLIKV